jgi:hypothetical protein
MSFWNLHRRQDGPPDEIQTRDLFRAGMYCEAHDLLSPEPE